MYYEMVKHLPVMLGKVLGKPIRVSLALRQNIITAAHHVGQGARQTHYGSLAVHPT
jgi:hypothetical protein